MMEEYSVKTHESKKTSLAIFTCSLFFLIISIGVIRITGSINFIGTCIKLLLPVYSEEVDIRNISFIANKGINLSLSGNENKNDNKSAVKINSLAYTPDDIQKTMNKAAETFDNSEKEGKIVSQTYGKASATDCVGNIYIKNTTGRSPDFSSLLKEGTTLTKAEDGEISVLIFHTHTTETYQMSDQDFYLKTFSPRSENESENMIRVGEEIVSQLKKAGIGVIHDKEIYDRKYSGAYERSGKAIDRYLEKYPSIQVVLDIHRDAIQTSETTKVKPVTTINGKKAAQIMIISGCEGDNITDFPNWQDNLKFALKLQKTAEEMYPTLMRPLFFCNRKYNMYKTSNSLLLEMGSDGNTLDEAAYSGRLIGDVLAEMLTEELY